MNNSSISSDLVWQEQQLAIRARAHLDFIELLKRFALVFALIVLTLTVATVISRLNSDHATSVDHMPSPAHHLKPSHGQSAQHATTLARLVH